MFRLRVLALCFACAFALALVEGGAAHTAQAAPTAGESFDPENVAIRETYRKAITDGVAEYDAGRFEEALSCFRRAHQLSPNARTFRGMGKAHFELRDYVAAVRNLTAALKDSRKPLSPEQREEVQDLLDRSRLFVAIYTLKVSPAHAEVLLDGALAEVQPDGSLMVGFGLHTVEVRAQGYRLRTLSLSVQGGERKPISVTLEPLAPAEPAAPAVTTAPAPEPEPQAENDTAKASTLAPSNRTAMMWFVGAGAAALLAGGAGIYWGVQESSVSQCRHPESGPPCENESDLVRQRNAGSAVTIAAGAAVVVMATIGILSWKTTPAQSTQTAISCGVGPFGVTCGGAF